MVAPTRLSLRLALDFLTEGSRVEAMTKSEDENPRSRHLEDLMPVSYTHLTLPTKRIV